MHIYAAMHTHALKSLLALEILCQNVSFHFFFQYMICRAQAYGYSAIPRDSGKWSGTRCGGIVSKICRNGWCCPCTILATNEVFSASYRLCQPIVVFMYLFIIFVASMLSTRMCIKKKYINRAMHTRRSHNYMRITRILKCLGDVSVYVNKK